MNTMMKKLLLLLCIVGLAGASYAAPAPSLSGHDLLVAVVGNDYPATPPNFDCDDFIPALKGQHFDGGCRALHKANPGIAFVGDSHIRHYGAAALTEFAPLNPIVISQTECFPFTADAWHSARAGDCMSKTKAMLGYLLQTPSIKTVVLSARWSSLMSGPKFDHSGPRWLAMSAMEPADRASFIQNGQHFIGALIKAGKQVVLMRDIPDLDFDPATCYNIRPVRLGKIDIRQDCSMAQAPFETRRQLQNAVLDQVLKPYPQVKVYDPVPVFCQNGKCKASDGTLPYYLNGDHVNNYGAQLVFKDFVPKAFPALAASPATK